MVSDLAVGNSRANLGDHPGRLVAGDQRRWHVVLAVDATQVTAANSSGHDLDPDLSGFEGCGVFEVVGETDVLFTVAFLDESLHGVLQSDHGHCRPSSR